MTNYSMRDCLVCEDRTMHDGGFCLTCKNNKINEMIEYLKLHIISLKQDLEKIDYVNSHHFYKIKEAEIANTVHLLSVAKDILNK